METEGILLKKYPIKSYDENLVFFTKDFGRIQLFSFGSRSPKSSRRFLLSRRDFLTIHAQRFKGYYQLKQLNLLKRNDFLDDANNTVSYETFFFMLKIIYQILPGGSRDLEMYRLLNAIAAGNFLKPPDRGQKIITILSLLKCIGIYPYFSNCGYCHKPDHLNKPCSDTYTYDTTLGQFYGLSCPSTPKLSPKKIKYILSYEQDLFFLNQFYSNFKIEESCLVNSLHSLNLTDQNSSVEHPLYKLSAQIMESRF